MTDRPLVPDVLQSEPYVIPSEISITDSDGNEIRFVTTKEDAKTLIGRLRLLKKETQLNKRMVTADIQAIRAGHRQSMANRPPVRGRGGLVRIIRTIDQHSKDRARANVANTVAPLESQKMQHDLELQFIDRTILELEAFAMRAPSSKATTRALKRPKHCTSCGHAVRPDDKFCQDCGGRL